MTSAKRDKIAPVSIFFLLYISRIVVTLTNVQSVTTGFMHSDVILSLVASMGATLIVSLPALFCYIKHKNPFDVKWVGFFYSIYFIVLAGLNISRFAYFASSTLNPEAESWMFCAIVAVCAYYGAYLGIEGLSRFSAFVFSLLIIAVAVVLVFNIRNFEEINLYPVITNKTSDDFGNILYMTSNSYEVVLLLCLSHKVNGNAVKAYVFSVLAAFFSVILLVYMLIGVMGDSAELQAFPLYSLFQLAKITVFEKLDIMHLSFWILGIFVKSVLLIYCSTLAFKPLNQGVKCALSAILTLAVSIPLTNTRLISNMPLMAFAIPYLIFCIIVPGATLCFKRRNLGDELIEKF